MWKKCLPFSFSEYISSLNFVIVLFSGVDSDLNGDEEEEKQRLITQVLELQNTLDGTGFLNFSLFKIGETLNQVISFC